MELLGLLWDEIITKPMTNSLLALYAVLGANLGVAIIAFTVLVRLLTYPLVVRQLRQMKRLQGLQPRIREINDKYKNNPQLRGQETMKLYREMGVNPVGCLGPLVIQMPIFIGLFWAINNVLPFTPENLAGLSSKLYGWLPFLDAIVPVNRNFLGLDLALDPMREGSIPAFILVGLSGIGMYVQQKMSQVPSTDPAQASTQRMMLFMFPVMFGMFSLFFPLGLVIYWVASTLIGIVMQYFISGWGGLRPQGEVAAPRASGLGPTLPGAAPPDDKEPGDGRDAGPEPRSQREDSGGGDRARNARTRRRPRRNRGRRS